MAETKNDKMRRIPTGTAGTQPLPEVPKLSPILSKRHPENKPEYDAYDQAWVDFFKKSSNRAS